MGSLLDTAIMHRESREVLATSTAAKVAAAWSSADPGALDAEWGARAPQIAQAVTAAQVKAATQAGPYVSATVGGGAHLIAEAFGGATREGRSVAAELYAGVTQTKRLIGRGVGVGQAFRAGTALMSLLAANTIRDAGRSADSTLAVANGSLYSVRVIQPGACSRCAILAGVKGYRTDFDRHPCCRCSSMPLRDDQCPEGFFRDASDYFESLTPAEQDRVFTKSGAWAIRNGADPINVVNARRGAYKTSAQRPDGSYMRANLRRVQIGVNAKGEPITVYATREGTTSRGTWGGMQEDRIRSGDDRYRRSRTLRLMPESIFEMTNGESPERISELLRRYGYIR